MKYLFALLVSLSISTPFLAQSNCPCCTKEHQKFDFWIGDWNVYNPAGVLVGENTITKLEDGCIVNEHWRGAKGTTGRSYNYFNSSDSTWNQLWIDNNGSQLILKGKGTPNQMILKSEIQKGKNGIEFYNQITWSKNKDGTVTQLWEVYNSQEKLISTAFHGLYKIK